jgi:hypothetical protein
MQVHDLADYPGANDPDFDCAIQRLPLVLITLTREQCPAL